MNGSGGRRPRSDRRVVQGVLALLASIAALGILLIASTPAEAAPAAAPRTLLLVRAAPAHPVGNFTSNRYTGIVVAPDEIRLDHVQDLAEIPTAQVKPQVDAMGMAAWARGRCAQAAGAMELAIDERPGEPAVRSALGQLRPGQAGLPTLRLECGLAAAGSGSSVVFRDDGGDGTVGWREITARGDRMTLVQSNVPPAAGGGPAAAPFSVSDRLTRYPQDLLSSPVDQRQATLRVRPGGPALASDTTAGEPTGALSRGNDGLTRKFTDLIARQELTVGFAALALLIAMMLGALHALAPGHGKTIMAAYAVARDRAAGARRDILTLGLTVTITHTAGVLVLGVLIASGSLVTPASVYPWLGVASGALVAVAGAALLRRALRNVRTGQHGHGHGHGHGLGHGHGHGHGHEEEPGLGLGHGRGHSRGDGDGLDSGERPEHAVPAEHGSGARVALVAPSAVLEKEEPGEDAAPERDHSPVPARAERGRGGAALMGFAGGMVPSPSAVLVLVGAAAIGQAWFGVLLVLAYGAGLALTLVLIGLLVVGSGNALLRRAASLAERSDRRWARAISGLLAGRSRALLPLGTAMAVLVVGVALIVRSIPGAL